MDKLRVIELNEQQKKELEQGHREGKIHFFRQLCQMVLLKSEGRTSKDLAGILGKCEQSINTWLESLAAARHRRAEGKSSKRP